MAAFLLGETEVREDLEQEFGIEIADITHIDRKGEIDGVALALDGSATVAGGNEELIDDVGIGDASIIYHLIIYHLVIYLVIGRRINMRRESKPDVIRQNGRSRRLW